MNQFEEWLLSQADSMLMELNSTLKLFQLRGVFYVAVLEMLFF